ncbi:MAG: class I SAM-dependent methyltransferase [Hyphomicrobium sp.]
MDQQQRSVAEEFESYRTNYKEAINASLNFPGLTVDFFTRIKADYLLTLLARHFENIQSLRALDIGCGIGAYHGILKRQVGTLTGVDVAQACVAQAAVEHPDVSYDHYDGSTLPYPDNNFDVAFTICVMHHVPPTSWPRFVAEAKRVLRPGGLFVVFEHNPLNPLTMRVVSRCPFDRDAVLLRGQQTVKLLGDAHFSRVQLRYILAVPAANPPMRYLDQLFGWLPLGAQYFAVGVKD